MFEHERKPLWAQIALGVALGILAAAAVIWFVSYQVMRFSAEAAIQQMEQTTRRVLEQSAREAQQLSRLADERARVQAGEQRQRQALQADQQRQAEIAAQARLAAADAKERAWQRSYQKPAHCDEARGGSWTVECANEYIRAQRKFEQSYAPDAR